MYEAAAGCKDIAWPPKLGTRDVTLAGYYAVRDGMKVQLVCNVTRLRYVVTL